MTYCNSEINRQYKIHWPNSEQQKHRTRSHFHFHLFESISRVKNQFDEIKCIGILLWTRRKCVQSLISKLVSLIYLFVCLLLFFLAAVRSKDHRTELFGCSKNLGSHKLIQIKHLKIKCMFHLKYTLNYADWVCFTKDIWCRIQFSSI